MKNLISLILIFLMLTSQAYAITGVPDSRHWIPASFGGGGSFTTLFADSFVSGVIYASPDVSAPYETVNRGDLWTSTLTAGGPASNYGIGQAGAFVQSRNDRNLMYAMDAENLGGGLFKSIDRGRTWKEVANFKTPKPAKYIAIDENDDNIVVAATQSVRSFTEGGRIWRTTNGGTTWNMLFRPFDTAIVAEPAEINGSGSTRTGFLNNENNILKGSVVFTSASGETFTDNGSGILVSNMGGSGTIYYVDPSNTSYGKYSLTFGTTPSATTVSYTVSYSPQFIALSQDGQKVFAGRKTTSGDSLVRYDINTHVMTPITLTGTNANYLQDYDTYYDASNVKHICIGAGFSVACTADDGDNWTYTAPTTATTSNFISRVAVRRKADDTLTFVINREQTSSAFQSVRQRSLDSGTTWQTSTIGKNIVDNPTNAATAGTPRLYSIISDPFDENVFYMSSDGTIWRSDNGGLNFAEKVKGAQIIVHHHIAIAPNGRIFATGMDMGVAYSDDFGEHWVMGTPDLAKGQGFVSNRLTDYGGHYWRVLTLGSLEDWNAGHGIVIISATMYSQPVALHFVNYVLKSIDNGVTWTRSNNGLPTVLLGGDATWGIGYARALGASKDGSVLYVGMDGQNGSVTGGLFRSDDLGETWQRQWPSTPNRVFNGIAVDPTDATGNTVLFCTFRYSGFKLTTITAENAEITGSGATRTGNLNKKSQALNPVFTSTGGEIFQPVSFGSSTLSSNLGGTGTYDGKTGAYSLTFASAPTTTSVTYQYNTCVGPECGSNDYIQECAYDSKGTPYALIQKTGAKLYKSVPSTFGPGKGEYGSWQLMKKFADSGLPDGIAFDPNDNNRMFVSITEGNVSDRRVWITTNAQNFTSAQWYDITGDLPVASGCRAIALNVHEGEHGFLYCASNGSGFYKLDMSDTPTVNTGTLIVGGN